MSQFNHSKPTKNTFYYPNSNNVASSSYQPSQNERNIVDEFLKKYYAHDTVSTTNTDSTTDNTSTNRTSMDSLNSVETEHEKPHIQSGGSPNTSLSSFHGFSKYSAGLPNLGNTCYM